jgi:hypothetical protein
MKEQQNDVSGTSSLDANSQVLGFELINDLRDASGLLPLTAEAFEDFCRSPLNERPKTTSSSRCKLGENWQTVPQLKTCLEQDLAAIVAK